MSILAQIAKKKPVNTIGCGHSAAKRAFTLYKSVSQSNLQLLKAQNLISTRNWGIYLAQRILIFPSVLGVDVYWISGIFGSILIAAHPKNSKYTSILACNLIRWLPTIHGAFTISQPQFSLSSNHECRNLGKKSTEKRMFTFGHCQKIGGQPI